jgi:hypothetical protein
MFAFEFNIDLRNIQCDLVKIDPIIKILNLCKHEKVEPLKKKMHL